MSKSFEELVELEDSDYESWKNKMLLILKHLFPHGHLSENYFMVDKRFGYDLSERYYNRVCNK